MLNLKNNKNGAVFEEICKILQIKIKFANNEGYFFGQHSLVENSPIATDTYIQFIY